jgi:hypothetical protein
VILILLSTASILAAFDESSDLEEIRSGWPGVFEDEPP